MRMLPGNRKLDRDAGLAGKNAKLAGRDASPEALPEGCKERIAALRSDDRHLKDG
jgi:hypothetical protein